MADTTDQTVVGSSCMFYRRQSGGVLLKNKCAEEMTFAVTQKGSGGSDNITNNITVGAKKETIHNTGGSENVVSVGIGSKT